MGNVSLAMPSIHPMIGINSLPAVNHQPEFAAHCVTPDADKALVDGPWQWRGPALTSRQTPLPANASSPALKRFFRVSGPDGHRCDES